MSRAIASAFAIHSLSLLLAANAVASTQPGDKPLSEILVPVEAHGTVISADQGRNRATGQELRRERENDIERMPPPDAKPLSAIALSLEQRGLGGITDVEFDNRQWDVDVRNAQGQRAELKVDPMTAEITRCRGRACP